MRRPFLFSFGLLLLLGAALLACTAERQPSRRVVVVSLDGAADWLVDDLLARGVLPANGALAQMSRTGVRAEAMTPIDPPVTAAAHTSLFTGAYPERTGIVSNTFLPRGNPISESVSGFSAPIQVETLWQAARRQGKRVSCATAVGADITGPERMCDLTLAYGHFDGPASVVYLEPSDGPEWKLGAQRFEHVRPLRVASNSPRPLSYRLDHGARVDLNMLAVDSTFDGAEHYDSVVLDTGLDLSNGFLARVPADDWVSLVLAGQPTTVASSVRLLEFQADLSRVVLYLGEPSQTRSAPPSFLEELIRTQGPWPGDPDGGSLHANLISEDVWMEQAERLAHWLGGATLRALQRSDWDLLLTYLPIIDETEHRFLLRDPRQPAAAGQPGYAAEDGQRRALFNQHVEHAYQTADRILQQWMQAAPPQTTFVIVSDHGMIPIHTLVDVHTLLRKAGFRVTADDTTEVRAYTSTATANIYVNLAGGRPGGVVPAKQLEAYIQRIVDACRALRDPVSGEPVFEAVFTQAGQGEIHLYNAGASGDVWLAARPGFKPIATLNPDAPLFSAAEDEVATHGYLSRHPRVQAIFFAAGPGIEPRKLGVVRQVDVAPTVAVLLGMEPPAASQGRNVLTQPQ